MSELLAQPAASGGVQRRRFTRAEFERAGELGLFGPGERLELISGEVVSKLTPQKSLHATSIRAVEEALRAAFGAGHDVRVQLPLALGLDHQPEPDVSVVVGSYKDYRHAHPSTALLVVEVADTTLAFDRFKAGLYALAGIPEYWLVNVKDGRLEVHRRPERRAGQPFEHAYAELAALDRAQTIAPLGAQGASILVGDLLP